MMSSSISSVVLGCQGNEEPMEQADTRCCAGQLHLCDEELSGGPLQHGTGATIVSADSELRQQRRARRAGHRGSVHHEHVLERDGASGGPLPPVYYPITYIPLPFRYLAYLSPTTYAAEIAQSTTGFLQLSTVELIFAWVILIAITLTLALIAVKKARWREV